MTFHEKYQGLTLPKLLQRKITVFSFLTVAIYLTVFFLLIAFDGSLRHQVQPLTETLARHVPAIQKPIIYLHSKEVYDRADKVLLYYSSALIALFVTFVPYILACCLFAKYISRQYSEEIPQRYEQVAAVLLLVFGCLAVTVCYAGNFCTQYCSPLSNQVHRREIDIYLPAISLALLYYNSVPFFIVQKIWRKS